MPKGGAVGIAVGAGGRDGEPSAMRMLSFKSSNALLLATVLGEAARGVPLDGGGGRGGGGVAVLRGEPCEALSSAPNRSAVSPKRSPVGTWAVVGGPKSAIKGFGAPGAACTRKHFYQHSNWEHHKSQALISLT